jgi:hypothetical protein
MIEKIITKFFTRKSQADIWNGLHGFVIFVLTSTFASTALRTFPSPELPFAHHDIFSTTSAAQRAKVSRCGGVKP